MRRRQPHLLVLEHGPPVDEGHAGHVLHLIVDLPVEDAVLQPALVQVADAEQGGPLASVGAAPGHHPPPLPGAHSLSISEVCGWLSFLALVTSRNRSISSPSARPSFSVISVWCWKGRSFFSFSLSWWGEGTLTAGPPTEAASPTEERRPHHSQQLLCAQDVLLHLVGVLLHLGDQGGQHAGLAPAATHTHTVNTTATGVGAAVPLQSPAPAVT